MSKNTETLRLFWSLSSRYPVRFTLISLLPAINVIVGAFIGPYIISHFFNLLQSGEQFSMSSVTPLILSYIATQIYGEIIGWRIVLYCVWTLETTAQKDLVRRIFSHLTRQSMSFHNDRFGGSIVSQTQKLFGGYERFTDTITFQAIPIVTSIFAAFFILLFIFWQYAVALLVLSLIFLVFIVWGTRRMVHYNTAEAQASTATTGRLADVVTNILAVKSYAQEDAELEGYTEKVDDWRDKSLATMRSFLGLSTGYSSLIAILNSTALIAALLAIQQHRIEAGVVYLCISYTLTVARQLWEMNSVGRNFNRIMGDSYDMVEILALEPTILDPKEPEVSKINRGGIVFDNVEFSHDEQGETLFKKLNLEIKPGEKVGLVGHSGSGKTTLTKLLLRFNDIDSGSIKIDGQDIRNIKQTDLRSHIAYVPQEPLLFHRSILENIRYGEKEASEKTVEKIAKMANAHEFIVKLPERYNTLVGERGVKLSGGQRQRVAIARAMIKNAPILLLDEATSALDSESEGLIQDALWTLMEGRTAIVIAHRLSTIQKMDRIIVMDDGKIVEQGSHHELIKQNGAYAKLWAHQSGGFIEE
jgi:ATP-binding cassette subfamily B protein